MNRADYAVAICERVEAFRAAEERCPWLPRFDAGALPAPPEDEQRVPEWAANCLRVLLAWSERCREADEQERQRLRQLRERLTLSRALLARSGGAGHA